MSENPNPNNGPAGTYDFGEQTVIINNLISPGSGVTQITGLGTAVKGPVVFTTKTPFLYVQSGVGSGLLPTEVKFSLAEKSNLRWAADAQVIPNGVETALIWGASEINVSYTPPTFPLTDFFVPYDGLYQFTVNVEFSCPNLLDNVILRVYKDAFYEQCRFKMCNVPGLPASSNSISVSGICDAQLSSANFLRMTLEANGTLGGDITVVTGAGSNLVVSLQDVNQFL